MTSNPFTQAIETKLYFVVLILFAAFAGLLIYNSSLDNVIEADSYDGQNAALNVRARMNQSFESQEE